MKTRLAFLAALVFSAAGITFALEPGASLASPAPAPNTVTVTASGEVLVAPSFLSMEVTVSGVAEVAEEAVADFAQAKRRALSGFEDSGLAELTIEESGAKLNYSKTPDDNNMNNVVFMGGGGAEEPEYGVSCKEQLEIRFQPADDVESQRNQAAVAIDVAVEAGLKLNSSGVDPYRFYGGPKPPAPKGTLDAKLDEEAEGLAEAQAQAAAMQRARVLATELAKLSGRGLGGIESVTLKSLNSTWKGLGSGVEVSASVQVTFVLQ